MYIMIPRFEIVCLERIMILMFEFRNVRRMDR